MASVSHAHDLMVDAETGARGFLATNDRTFLQPVPSIEELSSANLLIATLLRRLHTTTQLQKANNLRAAAYAKWEQEWLSPVLNGSIRAINSATITVFLNGKILFDTYRASYQPFMTLFNEWEKGVWDGYWILLLANEIVLVVSLLVSAAIYVFTQKAFMSRIAESVSLILGRMNEVTQGILPQSPLVLPRNSPADLVAIKIRLDDMIAHLRQQRIQEAQIRELDLARLAAEQAATGKAAFLSTMSHEIRTPLNGVLGACQILATTALTEQQEELVQMMTMSGEGLLAIVNDILDFSRIESGRLQLEYNRFSLRQCLEHAVDTVALEADKKRLILCLDVDNGSPDFVMGDGTRLRQTLLNLLSNAVKFTQHGHVVLAARVIPYFNPSQSHPEGRTVRMEFSVSDSGIGMTHSELARLFSPFVQADSSITRRFGGTGLGLSISQRLVKAMGSPGIEVKSEIGVGSKFSFELLLPVADEPAPSPSAQALQFSGKRALVLVESAVLHGVLTKQLNSCGLECVDSALGAPDLCVVDASLRAQAPQNLNIIVLVPVSYTGPTLATYVRKPVHMADLSAALQAALKPIATRRRAPSPAILSSVLPSNCDRRPRPIPPSTPLSPPLRILLAEDNLVNQRVACKLLKVLGYTADIANDGREAVEAAGRKDYDVILMDIHMPEMDGLEATKAIKERLQRSRQPCIVAMTADVTEEERARCTAAGMKYFVNKPVILDDLRAVLRRVSDERTASMRSGGG